MTNDSLKRGSVLVTGSTSQIGVCVLRRLLSEGESVVGAARHPNPSLEPNGARFSQIDLKASAPSFPGGLSGIVHIAGISLLPAHIPALRDRGVRRLVCFGSTAVYNKPQSIDAGERAMAQRMIEAERRIAQRCDALGIEWTILRPTLVYGLGMDRNISRAARFIRRFRAYPLATGAIGLRQPVHADDLAAAAIAALGTPAAAGKTYDVGGGETLAYREMIGRIFDALGMRRRFLPLPGLEYLVAAAGRVMREPDITGDVVRRMRQDLVCDNRPAAEDLGYRPRPFLAGGADDL